jgi:multidrug efflux pump subunit AcrA (membrane-fusion protein)
MLAGALALAIAAAMFLGYRRPHGKPAAAPPAAAPPSASPKVEEITLTGTVQPVQVVNVPAPVDGMIDEFMADAGQHVSAGQVLARIKNLKLAADLEAAQLDAEQARNHLSQLESALIAARLEVSRSEADAIRVKAEVDVAGKTFERQQSMFREGVTPRLTFEKAEQEYKSLRAQSQNLEEASRKATEQVVSITRQLEPARKTVAQKISDFEDAEAAAAVREVNSPADGLVIARRGKPGEAVIHTMSDLFQIAVDPLVVQAVASIDPRTALRVKLGEPVAVDPGGAGKVREMKEGQVFIDLANPPPEIRLGATVEIRIKLM